MSAVSKYFSYIVGAVFSPIQSIEKMSSEKNLNSLSRNYIIVGAMIVSFYELGLDYFYYKTGSEESMMSTFKSIASIETTAVFYFLSSFAANLILAFVSIWLLKYLFGFKSQPAKVLTAMTLAMVVAVAFLPLDIFLEYISVLVRIESLYLAPLSLILQWAFFVFFLRNSLSITWLRTIGILISIFFIIVLPLALFMIFGSIALVGSEEFFS